MAVVYAQMLNYTPGAMTFQQQNRDWSGSILGSYPNRINGDQEASFIHYGTPPPNFMGSYGAVIYTGTNNANVGNSCALILAWHVPGDGTNNRVYVKTTGPTEPVNWEIIKTALDKSSNKSCCDDQINRVKASASITSGNQATISVTFDIIHTNY